MKDYSNSVPRFELVKVQTNFPCIKVNTSELASSFIRQFYSDDIHIFESFFVLLVNNSNETIGFAKISQGGITSTIVDCRLVAHYAVQSLAVGIIIAHNHPSGNCQPSEADKQITKKLKEGLRLLDITILDHIILTGASYYSFSDNGIL